MLRFCHSALPEQNKGIGKEKTIYPRKIWIIKRIYVINKLKINKINYVRRVKILMECLPYSILSEGLLAPTIGGLQE
jgi:hypothetical protein